MGIAFKVFNAGVDIKAPKAALGSLHKTRRYCALTGYPLADSFPIFSDEIHHPKYDIEINLDQAASEQTVDHDSFRTIVSRDATGMEYVCQIPLTTGPQADNEAKVSPKKFLLIKLL